MNFYSALTKATATVMHTLPRSTSAFVGRTQEIETLFRSVATATAKGSVIAIHAINGMAGIGKTALAVHAGHALADNFPDGQIFLRLHAHTPGKEPVTATDALSSLLISAGVSPEDIPADLDARAALWRNHLAGKKVLLVLDDATGHDQIEPLLPGNRECLALVTSRRRLATLPDAISLPLDVLSTEQASDLFIRLTGRKFGAAEVMSVRRLVQVCGRLPLAISLLAGRLKHRPAWGVEDLAGQVMDALDRLGEFRTDGIAVAAAFDLSFAHLPEEQQQLFQLLGLHPGADFDAYSAAALANTPLTDTSHNLDALYDDHLLDELVRGRYQMHDLIREYARALAGHLRAAVRQAAARRLFNYYTYVAWSADKYIDQASRRERPRSIRRPAAIPDVSDQAKAITWFESERSSLLACVEQATNQEQHRVVLALASALAGYLRHAGPWQQAMELHQVAINAARTIQDRAAEARSLTDFGVISFLIGYPDAAGEALDRSVAICREIALRSTLARSLTQLGTLRRLTGNYRQARDAQMEALAIHRDLRDKVGQAYALTELGTVRPMLGDYPGAVSALTQALDIAVDLGDHLAEAYSLNELGTVRHVMGDYQGARDALVEALQKSRDLKDQFAEAYALNELGLVGLLTGDYDAASEACTHALEIYRGLGSKAGEADGLSYLGGVWAATGDYARSADGLRRALGLYRELKDTGSEARVLARLGNTHRLMQDFADAADVLARARSVFRTLGDLRGEAEASNNEADLLLDTGDPGRARDGYRDALRLTEGRGIPLEEARALEGLGVCAAQQGDADGARSLLQRALAGYVQINSPRAESATAALANTIAE